MKHLKNGLNSVVREIESRDESGIKTGFKFIDKELGSMMPGELIVLGSRPGMGKTALACNIVLNMTHENDSCVLIHSLELLAPEVSRRLLSISTGIDSKVFKHNDFSNDDLKRLVESIEELTKRHIWIDDSSITSLSSFESNIKELKEGKGLDVVIIDYMQLVSERGYKSKSRDRELNFIAKKLKELALEYQIIIMVLSQVSKSSEKKKDKIPHLDDLRVPSLFSSIADTVLLLHRDHYYDEAADPKIARIRIAKNRRGGVGECIVKYDPKTLKICNYTSE